MTGKNADILYYYDKNKDIIIKICNFNNKHNLGCLLLDKSNKKIFILSGNDNNICEYFDINNEIIYKNELIYDRADASFCITSNKIYGFFGYSYKKNEYLLNIEYIDKYLLDKWYEINLKNIENIFIKNISLYYNKNEPNNIIIYGGKTQNDELLNDYYYIYSINENNFEKIEELFYDIKKEYKRFTVTKKTEEEKKGYFFDKNKQFIEIPDEFTDNKNKENICIGIDFNNNIHFLTDKRKYLKLCKYMK